MKNTFEIEKTESGYDMTLTTKRTNFLRALFTGKMILEVDKDQAKVISKALYTPNPHNTKRYYGKRPATVPTDN
jgi:hypothetical protein